MRKIIIAALGLMCVSCAGVQKAEVNQVSEAPVVVEEKGVETARIEISEPCPISAEYPVFHRKDLDDSILSHVQDMLESGRGFMEDLMADRGDIDSENDEIERSFEGYYFSITSNVVEDRIADGVSLLFEIRFYGGGAHDGFGYGTLMLDAAGNEIDPWQYVSGEDGLKQLSDVCREQLRQALGEDLEETMLESGTEPDPVNFKNILRSGNNLNIYFSPYDVAPWSAGPQMCVYPIK